MGMRSGMMGIIGMMLMGEAMAQGSMNGSSSKPLPPPKKISPEEQLSLIREKRALLDKRIQEYSDKRPKGKLFEVQGFEIKAINLKNAIRGVRKCIGETHFRTELTKQEIDDNIQIIAQKVEGGKDESSAKKIQD